MMVQHCGCCGQLFLPGTKPWLVVDPGRPVPADWLCAKCEQTLEVECQVFVFTDQKRHVATLLSDRGMRAAKLDAMKRSAA